MDCRFAGERYAFYPIQIGSFVHSLNAKGICSRGFLGTGFVADDQQRRPGINARLHRGPQILRCFFQSFPVRRLKCSGKHHLFSLQWLLAGIIHAVDDVQMPNYPMDFILV